MPIVQRAGWREETGSLGLESARMETQFPPTPGVCVFSCVRRLVRTSRRVSVVSSQQCQAAGSTEFRLIRIGSYFCNASADLLRRSQVWLARHRRVLRIAMTVIAGWKSAQVARA